MGWPMSSSSARPTRLGRSSCRNGSSGSHKSRYQQADKSDVTKLPLPRTELLKTDRYMFGSMQISRGCPFTCEFCDIIVTFGRRPRLKTSEQVLAELEAFQRAGFKIVFIVDDNLIGNKKAIKEVLRDIIAWQQERAYPLTLFTEASLDLAEDEELMELMGLANFQNVFIGIETPNEESLQRDQEAAECAAECRHAARTGASHSRARHRRVVRHDRRLRP